MAAVATPSSAPPKSRSAPAKDAAQNKIEDPMFGFAARMFHPTPAMRKQTTKHIVQSATYPFNELADEYFYNVNEEDKEAVHEQIKEAGVVIAGSVVYVVPNETPKFFPDVYAFLTSAGKESEKVRALCVPGVGSSVLGAVGLARDIALARKVPVAGVVAGYGLRELVNDSLGGAFYFREINELEFALENMRRSFSTLVSGFDLLPTIETYDSLGGGATVLSMKALLRDRRLPNLEFLVGHSKGNLVLSGALGELVCENAPIEILKQVKIVLLSAVCALPKVGKEQVQIIGALDPLGWGNSRFGIVPDRIVPNAAHHLNREIPLYLDAVSELASL
jgi:hypothetical protein